MSDRVRARPFPFIIWWAIGVHLAWGGALAADPAVLPLAILVGLHWVARLSIGLPSAALGAILIVAALFATASLLLDHRLANHAALALLLPQYALLLAALVSDTQSIVTGLVNGQAVDRLLLFAALWPMMIAAVLHSLAILERHLGWMRSP